MIPQPDHTDQCAVDSGYHVCCQAIGRHTSDCDLFTRARTVADGETLEKQFEHVQLPEGASAACYWSPDPRSPGVYQRHVDWKTDFHGGVCANMTAVQHSNGRRLEYSIAAGFDDIDGDEIHIEVSLPTAIQLATVLLRVAASGDVK